MSIQENTTGKIIVIATITFITKVFFYVKSILFGLNVSKIL